MTALLMRLPQSLEQVWGRARLRRAEAPKCDAHHDVVEFTLPEVPEGKCWFRLIDSNITGGAETPAFQFGHRYQVTGRSLLVFVLGFEDRQPRKTREGIGAILDLAERPVAPEMV